MKKYSKENLVTLKKLKFCEGELKEDDDGKPPHILERPNQGSLG